jgi:hypothetical protein
VCRKLCNRAGKSDSADLEAVILGEPEVAVRPGGDPERLGTPRRDRKVVNGCRQQPAILQNLDLEPRDGPSVSPRAGAGPKLRIPALLPNPRDLKSHNSESLRGEDKGTERAAKLWTKRAAAAAFPNAPATRAASHLMELAGSPLRPWPVLGPIGMLRIVG